MIATITGPFSVVAFIRDFVQGSKEPYLNGSCGGFVVEGLEDDIGNGEAALVLSETTILGKDLEAAKEYRESFVKKIKKNIRFWISLIRQSESYSAATFMAFLPRISFRYCPV